MKINFAIAAAVWFATLAAAQNNPVAQSTSAAPAQPDQPGTPLKPELAGATTPSEPPGATLQSEPSGAALKTEPPGPPVRSEAAGTPPQPEPPGPKLEPEPAGTPTKSEQSGTPGRPATAAAPALSKQELTLSELRKKHSDSVAELSHKQAEEIKTLRESLKGKPPAGIRASVKLKKAEQSAALKALLDNNRTEMTQFRIEHTPPTKQGEDNTNKH